MRKHPPANEGDVGSIPGLEDALVYFCLIDYAKAFDCVDHNKLWKILKEWEYQTT